MTRLLVALVDLYKRLVSPLLPPTCRFSPSCSQYARLALVEHGALRGGAKALYRILRCQPFALGGIDLP